MITQEKIVLLNEFAIAAAPDGHEHFALAFAEPDTDEDIAALDAISGGGRFPTN